MRRTGALIARFAPPLALMGLIFFLSAQADLDSGIGTAGTVAAKLVHATEYGLLFLLWLRALRFRHPWAAAVICLAYAASDEFHQTFVHGRDGRPLDVVIDMGGAGLAALAYYRLRRRLDPAALGGDQDRLGAVDRSQLPVDVVEVGADGAGRQ